MSIPALTVCPGTLAAGFSTYSSSCLKRMFNGKRVSHILPYDPLKNAEEVADMFLENRKRISISGAQEKLSLVLDKNKLRLTKPGEYGSYILKPIPRDLKKVDQVPANEHLTMQIASQIYNIPTAENALVFFKNGDPAYITKRFDIKMDGTKLGKEDFATLAGLTSANSGFNFKYQNSYEDLAELIVKYVPAYIIEMEKFFRLLVFNYLFSNGDAHLKNFSLLETPNGDYILSPAYDLINTRIHVSDTDFALEKGLFKDGFKSEAVKKHGHPGLQDFRELARRIGISENRFEKLIEPFLIRQPEVESLIQRSFLNIATQRAYLLDYQTRRNWLNA